MRVWPWNAAVAGAGAAALAAGGDDPSAVWFAVLGVALGALGAFAGTTAWLVTAAVLAPAAWGSAPGTVAASIVLGTALAGVRWPGADLHLGAAAGVATAVAVAHLSWPAATGGTAAVAALVTVIIAVSGIVRLPDPVRRRVVAGVAVGAVALSAVIGAAAVSALVQRSRIERAVDAVEAGLDASARGDARAAEAMLGRAARDFAAVRANLDRPWIDLTRSVPMLGTQLDAVAVLVDAAAAASSSGALAAAAAEPDHLRPRDGRVDLGAVGLLRGRVADARVALLDIVAEVAAVRSPWLVPALDDALSDVVTRSRDAAVQAATVLRALDVVPALLGADGERRWLLIIQTPSELRGGGGFPGNYGVLKMDRGRIELETFGRITDVGEPANERGLPVVGPEEYVARYGEVFHLARYFQNSTASPHFPSVAEAMTGRYSLVTGVPVDAAIALDPTALAALLDLIGPVTVDAWDVPIDAANAERILLFDQYDRLADQSSVRVELLEAVARAVFDGVVGGRLPGPADVSDRLAPLLDQRNIQLWSARDDEERWLREIGASGELAPVLGDALAVITNNASEAKIDWYLRRAVSYDVRRGPDATRAVVRVQLHNDAPTTGFARYIIGPSGYSGLEPGTNRTMLSIFSPLALRAATVDGAPADLFPVTREEGRYVYEVFVEIPAGGTREVVVELEGAPSVGAYRLDVHRQPVVNPDTLRVVVDGDVLFDGEQRTDLVLRRR